jgi:peptide/nickel transport system permease protein
MGVGHKPSLYASLSVAVVGAISYFPMQSLFKRESQVPVLFGGLVVALIVAGIATVAFARIDRGPVYRTASITAFIIGIIMIVDKLMQTWGPYVSSGEVQYRPVPTIGERNPLIETNDFWVALLDTLLHMFLPTIALTLIGFAGYVRYTRGTLLDVLNQDYIRTARAKGLNERTVIMRHAFRNTMIPIVTLLVVDFASVVGGALITENVFAWRGMGTLFRQAIGTFDLNLLMGIFFVTATLALVANLVADLLYSALDPRVRVGSGKS